MRKTLRWIDHASDLTNGFDAGFHLSPSNSDAGVILIGDDVVGDITTTAVPTVGADATVNTIEMVGDLDFYRIEL